MTPLPFRTRIVSPPYENTSKQFFYHLIMHVATRLKKLHMTVPTLMDVHFLERLYSPLFQQFADQELRKATIGFAK